MKIYVIHENDAWVEPLRAAFDALALPYQEWFLDAGVLDFSAPPPQGVFYNRMSASSEDSVAGVTLIQQYIRAPEPFITRVEFVGGKFLYAVRVDTTLGFELCPADVCEVGDAMCPVGERPADTAPRFEIVPDFRHP